MADCLPLANIGSHGRFEWFWHDDDRLTAFVECGNEVRGNLSVLKSDAGWRSWLKPRSVTPGSESVWDVCGLFASGYNRVAHYVLPDVERKVVMLDLLLLLFFAKMQDYVYKDAPAWKWAGACSAVIVGESWFLQSSGSGAITLAAALILFVILFFYTWGYFTLLRRVADSLILWISVFLGGAVLPFLFLALALSKSAGS